MSRELLDADVIEKKKELLKDFKSTQYFEYWRWYVSYQKNGFVDDIEWQYYCRCVRCQGKVKSLRIYWPKSDPNMFYDDSKWFCKKCKLEEIQMYKEREPELRAFLNKLKLMRE